MLRKKFAREDNHVQEHLGTSPFAMGDHDPEKRSKVAEFWSSNEQDRNKSRVVQKREDLVTVVLKMHTLAWRYGYQGPFTGKA